MCVVVLPNAPARQVHVGPGSHVTPRVDSLWSPPSQRYWYSAYHKVPVSKRDA